MPSDSDSDDVLEELSTSARLVYLALEHEADGGPISQSDLAAEVHLPPRTVRRVADDLEGHDLIETRHGQQDGREIHYTLTTPDR
jgi:DNA-binding MarR family transcriptional regulator